MAMAPNSNPNPESPLQGQEHGNHNQNQTHNLQQTSISAANDNLPATPDLLPTAFSRDPSFLHLRERGSSIDSEAFDNRTSQQAGTAAGQYPNLDCQMPSQPGSLGAGIGPQSTGGSQNSFGENPPWQDQDAMRAGSSSPGAAHLQSNNPFRRRMEQRTSLQSVDASPVQGESNATPWAVAPDTPPQVQRYGDYNSGPQSTHPFVDGPRAPATVGPPSYSDADVGFSYPSDDIPPPLPPKHASAEETGPDGDLYESTPRAEVGDPTMVPSASEDLIDFGDEQTPSRQTQSENLPQTGEASGTLQTDIPNERPPSYAQNEGSTLQPQITVSNESTPETVITNESVTQGQLEPPSAPSQPPRSPTPMPEAQIRERERILAETYDVREVNWDDGVSGLRESPMLVQNENGPCPLLSLVNAMVMRNKPGAYSPLTNILRSKEKISVELLIHALFEELTTYVGENELPDIEDLGSFLTVLHTGMNVNPRLTAVTHPKNVPGTFLATRDTKLYSTFNIPLVHGWLAPPNSTTDAALVRAAEYHEDIQLLHFKKEELEGKMSRGAALTSQELQLVQDIETIQHFLTVSATQLSEFGLRHLNRSLSPGSISIFFRNEHFSTLFKHPHTHQLFTLVTDMGYASHAEVVWESLVDVNGNQAELYSGDFRLVGHAPSSSASAGAPHGRQSSQGQASTNDKSHTEQSDADYAFALALQFQDEEDQRARQGSSPTPAQTTNRNSNSSNNNNTSTNNNSRSSHPPLPWPECLRNRSSATTRDRGHGRGRSTQNTAPNRRSSSPLTSQQQQQRIRPLISTETTAVDDPDAPPPTYEQAAKTPVYVPPEGHPQHPGPFSDQLTGVTSASSAVSASSSGVAGPRSSSYGFSGSNGNMNVGRRGPQHIPQRGRQNYPPQNQHQRQHPYGTPTTLAERGREKKDCIVM